MHLEVTDPAKFEEYRGKVPDTIVSYDGKYLVRGGPMESVDGVPLPARTVILEFLSVERVKTGYQSPEYQAIVGLRLAASSGQAQFVEGVD
mgnify:CR=1 FL=1